MKHWHQCALSQLLLPQDIGTRYDTHVLLEEKLGTDLLYFACRHNVTELLLSAPFEVTMSGSSGPDVLVFKQFQARWQYIDSTSFEPTFTKENVSALIANDIRHQTQKFATEQLEKMQHRDDYLELLVLSIVFLENVPPRGIKLRAPEPVHYARWMRKPLQTFKI